MLISIGHQHFVENNFIVEILKPEGTRAARIRRKAAGCGMLIDVTEGKKIRSMIKLSSGHVILSAVEAGALESRRVKKPDSGSGDPRMATQPELNQNINHSKPQDPVDKRKELDRRRYSYSAYIPERRNGVERRGGHNDDSQFD